MEVVLSEGYAKPRRMRNRELFSRNIEKPDDTPYWITRNDFSGR
jgi:hypothetical protein